MARALREKLDELRADEVEVSFGLKTIGEVGNFAVGKAGVEANYTVALKWKNAAGTEMERRVKRAQRRGMMRRGKRIIGTD
ncbi:MAG: CU044_2847 family protein [Chloroflexota bacterium]